MLWDALGTLWERSGNVVEILRDALGTLWDALGALWVDRCMGGFMGGSMDGRIGWILRITNVAVRVLCWNNLDLFSLSFFKIILLTS